MSQQLFRVSCTQTDAAIDVNQQVFRASGTHKLMPTRHKDDNPGACVLQEQRVPPVAELARPSGAVCINIRLQAYIWILLRHIRTRRHARVDRPACAILGQLQSLVQGRGLLIQPREPPCLGQGPQCNPAQHIMLRAIMAPCTLRLQLSLCSATYSCKSRWSGRRERRLFRRF